MANIKDLKKRIKSTKQTLKITKAMKLISAAKMAKAQEAILQARPYAEELTKMVKTMSAFCEGYEHPFFKKNGEEKILLLVISSNKGLCGGYNSQLAKRVLEFVREHGTDKVVVYNIGKKVRDLIKRSVNLGTHYNFRKGEPAHDEVIALANEISNLFLEKKIGKVALAFNQFVSAIQFNPTIKNVLPLTVDENEKLDLLKQYPFDFKYDLEPAEILDSMIPEAYQSSLYTSVLDAIASEHAARMASMDNASKNCSELIKKFTLVMNKLRQAEITTELIEVVSGAEALNG